jgi:hypothetical protein
VSCGGAPESIPPVPESVAVVPAPPLLLLLPQAVAPSRSAIESALTSKVYAG